MFGARPVDSCLRPLVERFLENRVAERPRIAAALEALDFAVLRRIGHNLKGAGASFGFPELSRFGASFEEAAVAQDAGRVKAQFAAYEALLAGLEEAPASTGAPAWSPEATGT